MTFDEIHLILDGEIQDDSSASYKLDNLEPFKRTELEYVHGRMYTDYKKKNQKQMYFFMYH
jgi:hypothetical protein